MNSRSLGDRKNSVRSSRNVSFGDINRTKASIYLWDDEGLRKTKIVGRKLNKSANTISTLLHSAVRFKRRRRKGNAIKIQAVVRGFLARLQHNVLLELQQKLNKTHEEKEKELKAIKDRMSKMKRKYFETIKLQQEKFEKRIDEQINDIVNITLSLAKLYEESSHESKSYKTKCGKLRKTNKKLKSSEARLAVKLTTVEQKIENEKFRNIQLRHKLQSIKLQIVEVQESLRVIKINYPVEKKMKVAFRKSVKSIGVCIKKKSDNKKLIKEINRIRKQNIIRINAINVEDFTEDNTTEDFSECTMTTVNIDDFSESRSHIDDFAWIYQKNAVT